MGARPAVPGRSADSAPSMDGAFRLVVAMCVVLVAVIGLSLARNALRPLVSASPSPARLEPAAFLYPDPRPAPELDLVDQDGVPFSASRYAGGTTLLFFGYTHCPDICPATMGILTEAASADRWGVRYARVETGTPGEYTMSHTAEVFLVDGGGILQAHFPFGTQADAVVATLRLVAGATPSPATPTSTPAPAGTPTPAPPPAAAPTPPPVSPPLWGAGARP